MFTPLAIEVSGLAAIAIAGHKRYLKQYLYTKSFYIYENKTNTITFSPIFLYWDVGGCQHQGTCIRQNGATICQ